MSEYDRRTRQGAGGPPSSGASSGVPGKRTFTAQLYPNPITRGVPSSNDPGRRSLSEGLDTRSSATDGGGSAAERGQEAPPDELGAPLPTEIRGELEAATGAGLGHVSVYTGERGNQIAAKHGARAVAIGNDIHMADGQMDPTSAEGRELIAHEVAHVLQSETHAEQESGSQSQQSAAEPGGVRTEDSVQTAEDEADAFASQFGEHGGATSWRPAVRVDGGRPMTSMNPLRDLARRALAQTPDVAWMYLRVNQELFLEAIAKRLATIATPPHERLTWQTGGLALAFPAALDGSLDGSKLFARLPELLHPTDPWAVIDQHRALVEGRPGLIVDGREPKGPLAWNPLVGDALAIEVGARLRESFVRMVPRYVAQLDDTSSAPVIADLVASHPMDRVVARLLCDPRVVVSRAGARPAANGPKDPPTFRDGLRPIRDLSWLVDRDLKWWNWIEVKDPRDARVEEVAATLFQEKDEPPPSHLSYLITSAAPWFRVDPQWARKLLGKKAPPPSGPDSPHDANALVLAESDIASEVAIAQASDERKTDRRGAMLPPDFDRLRDTLERSERQILRARDLLRPWNMGEQTLPALNWVARYRDGLMGVSKERAAELTPVITGQQALLFEAVGELAEVASMGARAAPVEGDTGPITIVLRSYAVAIGESHLIDTARAQFAAAREAKAGLTLALLDRALTESHDSVRELVGSESKDLRYGGDAAAAKHAGIQRQLVDLRAKRDAGTLPEPGTVALLAANLKEHTLDTRIKALYVQLHSLMEDARNSMSGAVRSYASAFHSDARGLPQTVSALLEKLKEDVIDPWEKDKKARQLLDQRILVGTMENDTRAAQARFDSFNEKSQLPTMIKDAVAILERQEVRTAIVGTILQIAVLIGVSVVGGMAGAVVSGAVRGAMIADAAVASDAMIMTTRAVSAVAGIAADASVNAVGQTALQGGNAKEAWLVNFFSSAAVLVALRPLHGAAARLPTAGTKLHKGAVLTAEMITAAAVSYAVERALASKVPDERTAATWIVQGASMAVGRFITARLTDLETRLGKLAEVGGRKLHTRTVLELAKRAEQKHDAAAAVEAIDQHYKLLNDEAEQWDIVASKVPPEALRQFRAENEAERNATRDPAAAMLPLAAAGLTPDDASGRVWAGANEDIVVALDQARRVGIDVDHVEHDPSARRWRVRYNNEDLSIVEVKTRAVESDDAAHSIPQELGHQIASAAGARYVNGKFEIEVQGTTFSVGIRRTGTAPAIHYVGDQIVLDVPRGSPAEFKAAVVGKLGELRATETRGADAPASVHGTTHETKPPTHTERDRGVKPGVTHGDAISDEVPMKNGRRALPTFPIRAQDIDVELIEDSPLYWAVSFSARTKFGKIIDLGEVVVQLKDGNPTGAPEFSLRSALTHKGTEYAVRIFDDVATTTRSEIPIPMGKRGSQTAFALERFISRYKARFGHEPRELFAYLVGSNRLNYQREFALRVRAGYKRADAEIEAARKCSMGIHRIKAGYTDFQVEATEYRRVDLGDDLGVELVPTNIEVTTRKHV